MNLGWSDAGHSELRASDKDRAEARRLIRVALDEGRLDETGFERRVEEVRTAKTRGDLTRVTADLPARSGIRDWIDAMRVRGADREDGHRWLTEAAAQGRLTREEYEQRMFALSAVANYADFKIVIDGLPGWPGASEVDHLAGNADREAALAIVADAVADGRVKPVEAPSLEADVRHSRRVSDLDNLLAALAARVSDQERRDAVEVLTRAHRDGQLDGVEYTARTGRVANVDRKAELAPVVADLHGDARRLTESDRRALAETLERALAEGRLDLAEFDERVRAAHAAGTMAEAAPLVADLASPARPARHGWTDGLFDHLVANSALMTAPRFWIVKLVWKASTASTLLAYIYVLVWHPLWASILWLPLIGLLAVECVTLRRFAGPVRERRTAVIDGLRASFDRLRAERPAIERIEIEYPAEQYSAEGRVYLESVAEITIDFDSRNSNKENHPRIHEEIIRLLWLSRLYPLSQIRWDSSSPRECPETVRLTGAVAARLRHRYGSRPYGPYREGQTQPQRLT